MLIDFLWSHAEEVFLGVCLLGNIVYWWYYHGFRFEESKSVYRDYWDYMR